MRTFAYIFSIALIALAISPGIAACGSIINGSKEEVTIMAAPSDATITVDGLYHSTGFLRANLDRGSSHLIEISKAGYITTRIQTGNSVSGWYFANMLIFPIIGQALDIITGGAFTIDPNSYFVQLIPGSGPPIEETHNMNGYAEAIIPTVLYFALGFFLVTEYPK